MIFESSDWHEQPQGLSGNAKMFIRMGKERNADMVVNGDILDLLPLGKEKFEGSPVAEQFVEELDGYPIILVAGNHDPYPWLCELFRGERNIEVEREYWAPEGEQWFYFHHGHTWVPDWWFLRHIAPGLVEFMVEHLPQQWYWLSRRMGWLPGTAVREGEWREPGYPPLVELLWRKGWEYGQKHGCVVVIGHTHCPVALRSFYPETGSRASFIDGGTLMNYTYVEIKDGDAKLQALEQAL